MKTKLKLNLGCGYDKREGYLNLDIDPKCKPDKVCDVTKALPFKDSEVTEILLLDVLEHVIIESAYDVLRECYRVLEFGGTLLIRVPSVFQIVKKFADQPDIMMLFLYGDTTKSGVWGAHKYVYTPDLMQEFADRIGFQLISADTEDTNYRFVLKKQKKRKPVIVIYGRGWHPEIKTIEELGGEKIIVCTDLLSVLKNVLVSEKKVWCIAQPPVGILGKTVLRRLSRKVSAIYVKDDVTKQFVKDSLKYSHLKTILAE